MKIKRRLKYFWNILGIIFLALGSIAVYNLVTDGANSLFIKMGVMNSLYQNLILIGVALVFLLFSGVGFWKGIKRLFG